jgi:hypothetical protein
MANSSWLSERDQQLVGMSVPRSFLSQSQTSHPFNPSKLVDLGVNINQQKMNSSYVP